MVCRIVGAAQFFGLYRNMPLAIRNLGRFTKIGSSILIMALCGNALFPLIYGYYADIIGTRAAYWVLIPCYLYLVFYAVYGHKITSWKFKKEKKNEN